ncbi:MAG TPA: hypothetical protein VFY15_06115 [Acidimicrobiia bacterium]|nr:hypothetical protein [Acidimicrobiia bacterium]
MFRLSTVTGVDRLSDASSKQNGFSQSQTRRHSPLSDPAPTPPADRAIDCWCHGVAHLLSALGPEAALSLMARTVVDLVDGKTDTPVVRLPPHSV